MDIDTLYDTTLKSELKNRLKRQPLASELVNADNDSDLVNEVMWQIISNLNDRLTALEPPQK